MHDEIHISEHHFVISYIHEDEMLSYRNHSKIKYF